MTTELIEKQLKPVVGTVVTLSMNTEDEDLNEFLEEHGNSVLITSRENDMYWGDVVLDEVTGERIDLPYHFEYRDIVDVQYIFTEFNNEDRHYTISCILENINKVNADWAEDFLNGFSDKELATLQYLLLSIGYTEEI